MKEKKINYAQNLHRNYQRGDDMTTSEQLQAMTMGLSEIIGVDEPERVGSLRSLFTNNVWAQLGVKCITAFKSPANADKSLLEKWAYIIIHACKQPNNSYRARKYINYMKIQNAVINNTDQKVSAFYEDTCLVLGETSEACLHAFSKCSKLK